MSVYPKTNLTLPVTVRKMCLTNPGARLAALGWCCPSEIYQTAAPQENLKPAFLGMFALLLNLHNYSTTTDNMKTNNVMRVHNYFLMNSNEQVWSYFSPNFRPLYLNCKKRFRLRDGWFTHPAQNLDLHELISSPHLIFLRSALPNMSSSYHLPVIQQDREKTKEIYEECRGSTFPDP